MLTVFVALPSFHLSLFTLGHKADESVLSIGGHGRLFLPTSAWHAALQRVTCITGGKENYLTEWTIKPVMA